jgi:hypothetical protein
MKHEREKENLTKSHEIQKTTLLDEIDKVFSSHQSSLKKEINLPEPIHPIHLIIL